MSYPEPTWWNGEDLRPWPSVDDEPDWRDEDEQYAEWVDALDQEWQDAQAK